MQRYIIDEKKSKDIHEYVFIRDEEFKEDRIKLIITRGAYIADCMFVDGGVDIIRWNGKVGIDTHNCIFNSTKESTITIDERYLSKINRAKFKRKK